MKILLADNHPFSPGIADALRGKGHEVTRIGNSIKADRAMLDEDFDVVIFDQSMSQISQFKPTSNLELLAASGAKLPKLIMIAESGDNSSAPRNIESVLKRPYDADQLSEAIEKLTFAGKAAETRSDTARKL